VEELVEKALKYGEARTTETTRLVYEPGKVVIEYNQYRLEGTTIEELRRKINKTQANTRHS